VVCIFSCRLKSGRRLGSGHAAFDRFRRNGQVSGSQRSVAPRFRGPANGPSETTAATAETIQHGDRRKLPGGLNRPLLTFAPRETRNRQTHVHYRNRYGRFRRPRNCGFRAKPPRRRERIRGLPRSRPIGPSLVSSWPYHGETCPETGFEPEGFIRTLPHPAQLPRPLSAIAPWQSVGLRPNPRRQGIRNNVFIGSAEPLLRARRNHYQTTFFFILVPIGKNRRCYRSQGNVLGPAKAEPRRINGPFPLCKENRTSGSSIRGDDTGKGLPFLRRRKTPGGWRKIKLSCPKKPWERVQRCGRPRSVRKPLPRRPPRAISFRPVIAVGAVNPSQHRHSPVDAQHYQAGNGQSRESVFP